MKRTINVGKYAIISFLALGLSISSCKKETEEEEPEVVEATFSAHTQVQVPIVLKETGELCGPCGGWGWTAWEGVINSLEGKAFLWAQYSNYFVSNSFFVNSELDPANSVNNAFQKNFPYGGSKPLFYVNGTETSSTTVSAAETAANASIASTPVDVSAAYKIEWDGDNLTVTAQAKLYNNMAGNFFMGVYLVEDKVMATQSGQSGVVPHHLAMRGAVGGDIWGQEIIAGTANAGDIIEKTYTQAIPSTYNKDNLTIGVIIWRKNGTKYFYKQAATNQTSH